MKKVFAFLSFLVSLALLAGSVYYRLDSIIPNEKAAKKKKNVEIRGNTFRYQSNLLKLEAEPLLLKDLGGYYAKKGLINPFEEVPEAYNYVFIRVRIENMSKEKTLDFSPASATLDGFLSRDDTTVYEMFYDEPGAEKKLEILGKTLFLKPLSLPPRNWIERMLFFEYDDPFPTGKMTLAISNLTVGKEIIEITFPFRSKFVREKKE